MTATYETHGLRTLDDLARLVKDAVQPVILVEGTRRLPACDVPLLHRLSALLAGRFPSALFRSGNAEGSDTAFAEAIAQVDPARIEYVVPAVGMGRKRRHAASPVFALEALPKVADERLAETTTQVTPTAERLVNAHRGIVVNRRLAAKGRYLMRDTLKVTGAPEAGIPPATAGIFYVNPEDPLGGGTGHTIRVCLRHNVPVVFQDTWKEWL